MYKNRVKNNHLFESESLELIEQTPEWRLFTVLYLSVGPNRYEEDDLVRISFLLST